LDHDGKVLLSFITMGGGVKGKTEIKSKPNTLLVLGL